MAQSEAGPQAQARDEKVQLGVANVRSFAAALQCLKAGNKQVCTINISSGGVSVQWEDESKSLQASVFLKPQLFSRFVCGPDVRHEFGMTLQLLLDTLALFAASGAPMVAHYPGPHNELVCEVTSGDLLGGSAGDAAVCTWARIASLGAEEVVDLGDYWQEPASSFLCPGQLLREAVEDLEWPGGPVEVVLQQDPQRLTLAASGVGSLEVEMPCSALSGFNCAQPEVRYSYKYRHMKSACCNLPSPKDCASISTKVSIDAGGLLKVTHMLGLDVAPGGRLAQEHPSALLQSQRLYDSAKVAVIQFLIQPAEEGAS